MKTIERYIFGRLSTVFLMTLGALTGIVWATQALRQLDLVSSKGQTILQFLEMTLMALPFLMMNIAPFAFMIAALIVLNTLSNDSELIVISAAGASRLRTMKPVLYFGLLLTAILYLLSFYVSPMGLAALRDEIVRVRVDLVANIVKPGQFQKVQSGLTFHIRNRSGDGQLEGLVLDDRREADRYFTYEASKGHIAEIGGQTLLIMTDGTIQRLIPQSGAISIVQFESYAFDLTAMMPQAGIPTYKPSERTLPAIFALTEEDPYYAEKKERFDKEVNDRLTLPLYALAFGLIVFAFLGSPRTTRQGRSSAVLGALVSCVLLRALAFGAVNLSGTNFFADMVVFALPVFACLLSLWFIISDNTPRIFVLFAAIGETIIRSAEALSVRLSGGRHSGA